MYNHFVYLKSIAEKLKVLNGSFYVADSITNMVQLFGAGNNAKFPALVAIDDPTSSDNVTDSPSTRKFYSFCVICNAKDASTSSAANAKIDAETIARKIIAKMLFDSVNDDSFGFNALESEVNYSNTGKLLNQAQACMVSFTVSGSTTYKISPDDWV
jgi:hypothetical protein